MDAELRTQLAFHVTGKRSGSLEPVEGRDLRPAMFAAYRDLASLRYDFPVVLHDDDADATGVRSLTSVFDAILQKIAPRGAEGERIRRHALRLEQEIRRRSGEGASGALSELWRRASAELVACAGEELAESFERARAALDVDGEVVDCSAVLARRLFTHAWKRQQRRRLRRLGERIERLSLGLSEILKADFVRSESGRAPAELAAAVGPVFDELFDFAAMSRMLGSASSNGPVSQTRRERIENALRVLRSQPFMEAAGRDAVDRMLQDYLFDDCSAALAAHRARLPALVALVKAMAIAELEIEGRYVEAEHDAFFAAFDQSALGPEDRALLPDMLVVCVSDVGAEQRAGVIDILSSGLPIKVLVETDDVLGEALPGEAGFTLAGARLATMAIGLNDVYVLQSSAANLYAMRERIGKGFAFSGAALFSVFSGAAGQTNGVPPYLAAAAATQSRAFPSFAYDPSAGEGWALRFSLEDNPQSEADWPTAEFVYESEERRRVSDELAFTFADFVACDPRYDRHFARVPRPHWNGGMAPLSEWLAGNGAAQDKVPYILMVDAEQRLHRSIADEALTAAARRCRDMWRRLQELGGIHNSYAERLLAREKAAWESEKQRELSALKTAGAAELAPASTSSAAPVPAAAAAPAAPAESQPAEQKSRDEPYIETLRCTSCNECTNINNRMFAYDENKQAYIADLSAGTYRELVEAAESCQVSIIHPGKPRDPGEPDLEELIKRAEPFN